MRTVYFCDHEKADLNCSHPEEVQCLSDAQVGGLDLVILHGIPKELCAPYVCKAIIYQCVQQRKLRIYQYKIMITYYMPTVNNISLGKIAFSKYQYLVRYVILLFIFTNLFHVYCAMYCLGWSLWNKFSLPNLWRWKGRRKTIVFSDNCRYSLKIY